MPAKKQKKAKPVPAQKKEIDLLARRIRSLREQAGYSNYENFAYDHDIPRAQYGRYEKGQDIRFSSLVKIIRAFGLTPEEFFAEGFKNLPKR